MDDIETLRVHLGRIAPSTHWDGCMTQHPLCALKWSLDEVERLRMLCAGMADLLEDCRPADATISWVLRRLDLLEQWRGSASPDWSMHNKEPQRLIDRAYHDGFLEGFDEGAHLHNPEACHGA